MRLLGNKYFFQQAVELELSSKKSQQAALISGAPTND